MEITAMKVLRLVNENLAGPIFCPHVESMGHISVVDLPISEVLRDELFEWDTKYQATFDDDYPPDSGFATSELAEAHRAIGKSLAERLQRELGSDYVVEYQYL